MPKFNGDFIAVSVEANISAQWSGCLQRQLVQFEQQITKQENNLIDNKNVEEEIQENECHSCNCDHEQQFDPADNHMNLSGNGVQNENDIYIECKLPEYTELLLQWCYQMLQQLKDNDFTGDNNGKCFQGKELLQLFDFHQLVLECIKQIIMINPYLSQASLIVNIFLDSQILANRYNRIYAFIKANNMPIIRNNDEKVWIKLSPQVTKKLYLTYDEIQGCVHGFLLAQIKK